ASTAAGTVQFAIDGANFEAPVAVANGVATLTTSALTAAKTYTVDATYGGDANSNGSAGSLSGGQVVTSGAPKQLTFLQQPADTQAGQAIAPAVTVRILDAAGNLTASTANVRVTANGPAAFTGGSTTTVAAAGGVATFSNLRLNTAGITGTSATITVNPGAATVLVVTAQAAAVAGTPFDVTVEAQDGFGNRATGYAGTVHFDITDSTADALGNHTFNPGTDAGNH